MQPIEDVEKRLRKVLTSRVIECLNPNEIQSDTFLVKKGLDLDSVALLEFVVGVEEEFDVSLDDSALTVEHFQSLGALARFVQGLLAEGQPDRGQ